MPIATLKTAARKKAAEKAAAEKATMKKRTPPEAFTNTLGMRFVPVPGSGVAFCIWETRVKDYAAYAAANEGVNVSWKNPTLSWRSGNEVVLRKGKFTQQDTHPVVKVNWNDANEFCAWLTRKEFDMMKINGRQKYRLPTDAEWSVAVGLGRINLSPEHRVLRGASWDLGMLAFGNVVAFCRPAASASCLICDTPPVAFVLCW